MRVVIGGLIGALMFSLNVYAEQVSQIGPVTPITEIASSQIESAELSATNMLPVNAAHDQQIVVSQTEMPPVNATIQPSNLIPQGQGDHAEGGSFNAADAVSAIEDPIIKDLANRLTVLEIENHVLQNQITQLSEQINGQISSKQKTTSGSNKKLWQPLDNLRNYMGPQLFIAVIVGVVAIFLFLLIYIIVPHRRETPVSYYPQDELPPEEDFNLMAGKEGIAAKLNLARAYIEMGHESKAQAMLYEVLSHGTDAEQEEAKALLEKIKQHNHGVIA